MIYFLTALFVSTITVPFFGWFAKKLGIYDRPDGYLKPHKRTTPYFGGLGIYAGMLFYLWEHSLLLVVLSILLSLGLLDDIFGISPTLRLVLEFIMGIMAVVVFSSAHTVWFVILIIGYVALINAVNMMDGMDGLCAGNVLISSLFFYAFSQASFPKSFSLVLAGATLGYLFYNLPPAKIFMVDAGSYILGASLGILYITCAKPVLSLNSILFLYPIWIYVFDLIAGIIRRAKNGKNPFEGDRDHLYDKIKRRLGNEWMTLVTMYLFNVSFSSLMFLHSKQPILAVALLLLFSAVLFKTFNLSGYDQSQ